MARGDHTEYGGGDGTPGRHIDGSAKDLSVGEQARLLRQRGVRDFDVTAPDEVGVGGAMSNLTEDQALLYAEDVRRSEHRAAERAALLKNTNGYSEEI